MDNTDLMQVLAADLAPQFAHLEEISLHNHRKVAQAFKLARIATEHFILSTGYGHDDLGRQKLDELFARIFKTEAALVRSQFVSGTHAIACALSGNLKPGDELIFATGQPYDTLEPLLQHLQHHLKVKVHLAQNLNWQNPEQMAANTIALINKNTKIVAIQRSCGYSHQRSSLNIEQIQTLIAAIKPHGKQLKFFVDNCYGEFTEKQEPSEVGADLMAGSLIKNPGGGLALTGGYVVGEKALVENAAVQLTAPGIGSAGGVNFGQNRLLFQGIYLAPQIVKQALKSSLLAARVLEHLGYQTNPSWQQKRSDLIQRIDLGSRENLIAFCQTLQKNSPVDSHLSPIPDQTPGYNDQVIMAGGTFIEGSTIELSADGPLREPFSAYLQGGLSYQYTYLFLEQLIKKEVR